MYAPALSAVITALHLVWAALFLVYGYSTITFQYTLWVGGGYFVLGLVGTTCFWPGLRTPLLLAIGGNIVALLSFMTPGLNIVPTDLWLLLCAMFLVCVAILSALCAVSAREQNVSESWWVLYGASLPGFSVLVLLGDLRDRYGWAKYWSQHRR